MEILATATAIHRELRRLIKTYPRYTWAVAWAGIGTEAFSLLRDRKDRIAKLVVGTHFYQTHPDFIWEFIECPSARFVMQPDGVFHPKVYLFEASDGSWECILGSPNFTPGGLGANAEVAALISGADNRADSALLQIRQAVDLYWEQGRGVSVDELIGYEEIWKRKQKTFRGLSGRYDRPDKPHRSPLDVEVFRMTWGDYFGRVRDDENHSCAARVLILKEARQHFAEHQHFSDIPYDGRRGIAGTIKGVDVGQQGVHWLWFGSMIGAGHYKHAVNANSTELSLALDKIPLAGEVKQGDFNGYASVFQSAFPDGGAGIATATRLLAMKRPDWFLCVDSKNLKALCGAFGIPQSITFSNYWECVVERLKDSVWWNAPEPEPKTEEWEVWKGRAAFMDAIFYEA